MIFNILNIEYLEKLNLTIIKSFIIRSSFGIGFIK